MQVSCVILAGADASLNRAVDAQDHPPLEVLPSRGWPRAEGDWLWLLDGSALPRKTTLSALLAAAKRLEGIAEPVVLASRVVDDEGRLALNHVPMAPQDQTATAIETVTARVLPVRAVSAGSLLVEANASGVGVPHPRRAMAWTAAVLRNAAGFVVPDSVADARGPGGKRATSSWAALLLGGGLRGRERLRFAAELIERAGTSRQG